MSAPDAELPARIAALILAAGESRRIGSPKALLRIGDVSFLRHIVQEYRNAYVENITVVLGASAESVYPEAAALGIRICINPDFMRGQLSSIVTGLDALPQGEIDAVFVHPVDHPWVAGVTIRGLLTCFRDGGAPVIVPKHSGRRGHPVLFAASLFPELRAAPPAVGARQVVWTHADSAAEYATDDQGVVFNVNTPDDYEFLQRTVRRTP